MRAAFLGLRAGSGDPTAGWDTVSGLLAANARRAAAGFDEPLLGRLETGAPADVIVLDGPPPPVAQVRAMDRAAIEEFGIPGYTLMERAAAAALAALRARWPAARSLRIFCGAGNMKIKIRKKVFRYCSRASWLQ